MKQKTVVRAMAQPHSVTVNIHRDDCIEDLTDIHKDFEKRKLKKKHPLHYLQGRSLENIEKSEEKLLDMFRGYWGHRIVEGVEKEEECPAIFLDAHSLTLSKVPGGFSARGLVYLMPRVIMGAPPPHGELKIKLVSDEDVDAEVEVIRERFVNSRMSTEDAPITPNDRLLVRLSSEHGEAHMYINMTPTEKEHPEDRRTQALNNLRSALIEHRVGGTITTPIELLDSDRNNVMMSQTKIIGRIDCTPIEDEQLCELMELPDMKSVRGCVRIHLNQEVHKENLATVKTALATAVLEPIPAEFPWAIAARVLQNLEDTHKGQEDDLWKSMGVPHREQAMHSLLREVTATITAGCSAYWFCREHDLLPSAQSVATHANGTDGVTPVESLLHLCIESLVEYYANPEGLAREVKTDGTLL